MNKLTKQKLKCLHKVVKGRMSNLEAKDKLRKAWRAAISANGTPQEKLRLKQLFATIREIRSNGWCVYWNNFVEPYMT